MNKRVIIVGHSLNDTNGLAYVASLLIKKYLELKYDIGYFNISTLEMNEKGLLKYGIKAEKIKIVNANVYDKKYIDYFDKFYKDFRSELVITIHDPWLLDHVVYSGYRNSFFWVAYQTFETPYYPDNILAPTAVFPVSGKHKSLKEIFTSCDLVIPCSPVGVEALSNYGIDQKEFVYLGLEEVLTKKEVEALKTIDRKFIFGENVTEDKYIFMTLGVNNQRKKLDRTITAFAEFLKKVENKDKYILYIHSELNRNFGGTDIYELIKYLDIKKNILIESTPVKRDILLKRYANIDCYISLFGAEGFAYPFVDALMMNKPVIYTNYATPAVYCKEYGRSVKVQTYIYSSSMCMQTALADIDDAVNQMLYVVNNTNVNNGSNEFVQDTFDWNKNFKKFNNLIIEKIKVWRDNPYKIKLPVKRIV